VNKAIEDLKKSDTAHQNIKIPNGSSLRGMDRKDQVKKIEDYIFMVKIN